MHTDLHTIFDSQIDRLIELGYPKAIHISDAELRAKTTALKSLLDSLELPEEDTKGGTLPFVLVISREVLSAEEKMERVHYGTTNGVTILRPHTSDAFQPIDSIAVSEMDFYLIIDIDRGDQYRNVTPKEAASQILADGRSPLTIDEGVAIVTHYPEFLRKNHCFSLLASRTGKDKRVPAIWINKNHEPNLGWCWEGNPHTWLGSASCTRRLAPTD